MNFLKTTKGLIITALVLIVITIIISYNWETIKGWFTPAAAGRYASPGSGQKQACVKVGDGCSYLGLYVPCTECSKRGISIS